MKFFPELASCWGGAIITPEAEAASGGLRQAEEQGGYRHAHGHKRPVKVRTKGGASTHWKPKLNAISEDSPIIREVNSGGVSQRTAGIDGRKQPLKVKHKSPAKAAQPPCHVEDYWKSSQAMALPAFSPTSFLF